MFRRSSHYTLLIISIVGVIFLATITNAANPASPFVPSDNVQDPGDPLSVWGGCGPTDSNCYVSTLPNQTGNAGKYLTTDGTTTSWATVAGGWSDITAPGADLTLAMDSYFTAFNYDTLTTQNAFTLASTSITTGKLFTLSSNSTALTSGGLFNVLHSGVPGSSWTGDLAKIESTGASTANLDGTLLKLGYTGTAGASDGTVLNLTSTQTGSSALVLRVNDDGTYTDTTPFVVDVAGRVGIGTATPAATFEVHANAGSDATWYFSDDDVAHGITAIAPTNVVARVGTLHSADGGLLLWGASDGAGTIGTLIEGTIGVADPTDSVPAVYIRGDKKNGTTRTTLDTAETVFQVYNFATPLMTFLGNGSLGVGDVTPDYFVDIEKTSVDTNIFALTDSDGACLHNPEAGSEVVTCSSDERLKTNIADASSALNYFKDFRIRQYDVLASGDHMTGVIAQEVLQINPELVTIGADGMYSVQLPNQWQVVKAIQEMDIKLIGINDLTTENTWRDSLVAWFGNVGNGIKDFVADKIKARQEICINETCINENQLKQLLQNQSSGGGGGGPTPEPTPPPAEAPVDLCPNIDGDQTTVPEGMYVDESNNCVSLPMSDLGVIQ